MLSSFVPSSGPSHPTHASHWLNLSRSKMAKKSGKVVCRIQLQLRQNSRASIQGHWICAALRSPVLREAPCCPCLEMWNTFRARGLAFLFCTGLANYVIGPAKQSTEGQEWSWEENARAATLPNCSSQSLCQFELLANVGSCLGNHKFVMVLIRKFARIPLNSL